MRDVLELLLAAVDEAYERKSWHGPNLRAALRGVTPEEALRRPKEGRHDIWELATHVAYWKYAARRRLLGLSARSFAVRGSNWFPSPAEPNERAWREVLRLVEEEHRALREAIASMGSADLRDPKKIRVVRGVAAHDLYHAGQIQLVKKLIRS